MNWRKRLAEILARMAEIRGEISEVEAVEAPTDEDATRAEGLLTEWDTLEAERVDVAAKVEKLDRIAAAVTDPANVEPAFHAPAVTTRRDPFENIEAVERGMVPVEDIRARALAGIEAGLPGVDDAAREAATRVVERSNGAARLALLTGSPAYRSAFEKILRHPESYQAYLTPEEGEALRAAMSTTAANGGYAIPFLLDPSIILTNAGSSNPFRQIARVVSGTSNKWNGITSAGVTAEWLGEASEAADKSPTLGQPSITAHKAAAYVFGSYEVFEDTNLASELPGLIQDGKDRLEAAAFVAGSGSGAPYGVVTQVTAVTASRVSPTTAGTFTTASRADVDKVIEAVPTRHRSRASWVANYSIYGIIRRMDTAGGGSFWANLGANQPSELLGRPIYESSEMASATTTGSNILLAGDFQNYVIYDRLGMTVEFIPNVFGSNGRPTGQRGWFAHWRVGADVVNADAFRVLKL